MNDIAGADTAKADARAQKDTKDQGESADATSDAPCAGSTPDATRSGMAVMNTHTAIAEDGKTNTNKTDKRDAPDEESGSGATSATPDMPAQLALLMPAPPPAQPAPAPTRQADGETADGAQDSAPVTAAPAMAASSAPQAAAADKTASDDMSPAQEAAAQQSPVPAAKPAQPDKKAETKAKPGSDNPAQAAASASPSLSNTRMDAMTFDPAHSQGTAGGKSGTAGNRTSDPVETRAAQAPQADPAPTPAALPENGQTPVLAAAPIAMTIVQNSRPGHAATDKTEAQSPAPDMDGLAVQIAAKSQSGAKQFDIRLDPPELGRVDVRLSIDAAGKAQAHLTADQPQTLALLQQDSASLTRALREAGLDVSQNGLNFSLRGNSGGNADAGTDGGRGGARRMPPDALKRIEAGPIAATAWRAAADGRLDIRV